MKKITLYTKEGCTLCDQVKAELDLLQNQYPHVLEEVDITEDQSLFSEYRYLIPIVACEGEIIKAPISRSDLMRLL